MSPTAPVRALVLGFALVACGRAPQARLARDEAILMRQVQGLEELVRAAEAGQLVWPEWIHVGVDEALLGELIGASLPQERVLHERVRVRVERAEISLRSSLGLVTLHGRVSRPEHPDTYADLTLTGSLGRVAVEAGVLRGQVELIDFEVRRAAAVGVDSGALRALVAELGEDGLAALAAMVPPLELPVRLEDVIRFDGMTDGPVRVAPASLPLRVSVARVMALSGRLWVFLDVKAGPWRGTAAP